MSAVLTTLLLKMSNSATPAITSARPRRVRRAEKSSKTPTVSSARLSGRGISQKETNFFNRNVTGLGGTRSAMTCKARSKEQTR